MPQVTIHNSYFLSPQTLGRNRNGCPKLRGEIMMKPLTETQRTRNSDMP